MRCFSQDDSIESFKPYFETNGFCVIGIKSAAKEACDEAVRLVQNGGRVDILQLFSPTILSPDTLQILKTSGVEINIYLFENHDKQEELATLATIFTIKKKI